jgi:ankyrin repeat protein
LNLQDNMGYTPLHIAAGNNLPDMVSALLAKGALTNILDNNGQTAKQAAASLNYSNIVALIP